MDYFYLLCRRWWQANRQGRYRRLVRHANRLEDQVKAMSDEALTDRRHELHLQAQGLSKLDSILPEALAIGRELSRRVMNMRHYDVQLMGTLALYEGCIAEMDTGEGKTLMAPLAAYLYCLGQNNRKVHVVTANEYLAARDAQWMKPLCEALGLTVGLIVPGQGQTERAQAYQNDVVYATAKEIVFDSLREPVRKKRMSAVDSILRPQSDNELRPHYDFAIVDEVDSVLIDQAQSPFSIGGTSTVSPQLALYRKAAEVSGKLVRGLHYRILSDDRQIEMKDEGIAEARRLAGEALRLVPMGMAWQRYVTCALAARHIYKRDQHYVVHQNRVVLIDESTGRMLPGRQLPDGIHQALEVANGLLPSAELRGSYSTTFQTFFRKYDRLAGMTGTAQMAAHEFLKVYNLPVVPIPPNKPSQRELMPDQVFRHRRATMQSLLEKIESVHASGRPLLIATGSVQGSEQLSQMLQERGLEHEVLNAKNHSREAAIIAEAGQPGRITVITNMAGRGVDITLGEGVAEKGGICLLSTDRLPYRRWDDQLAGRIGRQGDPGQCQFFLSLKDDVLRYGNRKAIGKLRRRSRKQRNAPVDSDQAERLFHAAQAHVEKVSTKHRQRTYQGEKQREQLKEKGLWEDWMDLR